MQIDSSILKFDEKAAYALRSLYRSFGYSRYKMSKFEEYALYIRNKDYLVSEGIISFTDTNGRLLALKPDVTLSIINNSKDEVGKVQKMYYDENVYRISKNSHSYKEIKQTGLECIGDIGLFELCEVVLLALSSLETISKDYIFEISHIGILESVFVELGLDANAKKRILECISIKSEDELSLACQNLALSKEVFEVLKVFVANFDCADSAVNALKSVCKSTQSETCLDEFCQILDFINSYGVSDKVRIDFSLTNDMSYYSGIVFKGYIKKIPVSVLSGGRYDKLMKNMGRTSGAVGFAVYLDTLERFDNTENNYDVDVVLLCDSDISKTLCAAREIVKSGKTVRVCKEIPCGITYRQVIKAGEDVL